MDANKAITRLHTFLLGWCAAMSVVLLVRDRLTNTRMWG